MAPAHAIRKTSAAVILHGLGKPSPVAMTTKHGSVTHPDPLLHSPRQNRLLAALSDQEYAALLPHLELVRMPLGWSVHGAGAVQQHLYFITEGIVSCFYVMENGSTAEFAPRAMRA